MGTANRASDRSTLVEVYLLVFPQNRAWLKQRISRKFWKCSVYEGAYHSPGNSQTTQSVLPIYRGNSNQEGVLEGRDDPVEIGDLELWLDNVKKARTFTKVLSSRGHDVVDQDNKNDDRNWLDAEDDDEFALREELEAGV